MAKKILVVDDEWDVVELITARLKANGFDVVCAYDGKNALQEVKNEKPDLIILDIMMPELNGSVLCGILKSDEELKSIPIVVLTGQSRELDRKIGRIVKADAYITKPFEAESLLKTINDLLKN
ncbi:MAG: response regulator [Candidatus Omnitrophica bacterium]|nr:response regulator [Candidatus Omnitrophota bacterium]